MVTATVRAREETRPAWAKDQTRRELHEGFDIWLDSLEEAVKEGPPNLDALARSVFASHQELTALVTEALVQQLPPGPAPEDGALSPV